MTDPQTQSTRVGVVAESGPDERRVALVPKAVASLVNRGVAVVVEAGAGERALLPDELYTAVGASIGDAWAADVVVKVAPPTAAEVGRLRGGQAGLQALATAKRLGARTTGYDVRPEVADQVRSVGAQWLDLGISASGEGGYARELTDDERAQQQKALEEAISGFDVVITTALVPGRPAPTLVTAAAVEAMKPGSVVVDLAGETGGNCELTEPGRTVVKHDVTIAAPLNLPATMPEHASELYSKNITALLDLLIKDGRLAPDFDDEVIAQSCVTRGKDS